ncbi:hypothetical protein B0T20DRAFT_474349 [Sordaria brevicollis]|uniref:NB-ARC domain-containing protein n=1 Tax=Sordaria brevicollis TaxID=83679 RepID=A0AAE0PM83_SORBR|nr:hypothetical protein B0T20DRAFT_474349 [Sordaria brevicollis]
MSRPETIQPTGALALIPQSSRVEEAREKADKLKILLHRHNIEVTRGKDVLDALINQHESRKPKLFDKLQRVANNIQAFSKAIGSICQIHGIASVGFVRYVNLLDKIVDVYDEMSRCMEGLQAYAHLYQRWPNVPNALLAIYCAYLDFSINVVDMVFARNPLWKALKMMVRFTPTELALKEDAKRIRDTTKTFNDEVRLVGHTIGHDTWRKVSTMDVRLAQSSPVHEMRPPRRIFSVSKPRNGKFCGREQVLEQLKYDLVLGQGSPQTSCTLHGAPGMGKTQVALEFAYICCTSFPELHVFWIPAENETVLAQAFGKIARLVIGYQAGEDVLDQARLVETATAWLCENTSWLMIFDNVNNPSLFQKYQPCCNHGSILVTSQYQRTIHATTKEILLKPLAPQEGSNLILNHIPEDQKRRMGNSSSLAQVLTNMSEEVSGSPLVLLQIAGSITSSAVSAEGALNELRQSGSLGRSNQILNGDSTWGYDRPPDSAWDMALRAVSDKALTILKIMSMLSADSIPVDMLNRDLRGELSFLGSTRFREEIQAPLAERYLIEDSSNEAMPWSFYGIHRQLQSKLLRDLQSVPDQYQLTFDRAVALIARDFPAFPKLMTPNFSQWPSYEKLIAHVLKLHWVYRITEGGQDQDETTAVTPLIPTMAFAELLASAGYYFYEIGQADSCVSVLETAENIFRDFRTSSTAEPCAVEGDQPSLYANSLKLETSAIAVSWGIIEQAYGLTRARNAMAKAKQVVTLREKHVSLSGLCPEDKFESQVLLSNAYNDVGTQMLHMHQYAGAVSFLNKSLDLKRQLETNGHTIPAFEFAESTNNMAFAALGQNLTEEALLHSRTAVDLINKDGSHDSDATRFSFCLGVVLVLNGEPHEALKVMRDVYEKRREIFGESGRQTRDTSYAISFIHYSQRRFEEANKTIQGCFIKQAKGIWPAECLTRAKYLQSQILKELGELAESKRKYYEALQELDGYLSDIFPNAHARNIMENTPVSNGYAVLMAAKEAVWFDYVVPFFAGRFTAVRGAELRNGVGYFPPLEDLE